MYNILNDTTRFLLKQSGLSKKTFKENEYFDGAKLAYVFQNINDSKLPTKGISFQIAGSNRDNIKKSSNNVGKFGASTNIYLPLNKKFSVMLRGCIRTLAGDPQFFQYNKLGGSNTLRAYQRDRFSGNNTAFWNLA